MEMKPKALAGFIILFLILAMIPPVIGNGWPEEQTRHIQAPPPALGLDTDMFVTGSGLGFHTELVTVLDPNLDIYAYLFFRDIKLNSYFFLENATLRLHTASSLDFDADSSFTIYGIPDYRYFGMGDWGYGSPASIRNAPLTSANVPYNSSQFYGGRWWDIDVTNIVRELYSNPYYEGPGVNFNNQGDYIAFIILGASGSDTRWFYDLSAGNGYEAQLHLHWDFSPPPPSGYPTAIFNETYHNYTIWEIPGAFDYPSFDPMEYVFSEGTVSLYDLMFDTIHTAPGTPVVITQGASAVMTFESGQHKLIHVSNGTIFVVYHNVTSIYIEKSIDEGATWIDGQKISTYPGMDIESQLRPSIAVDSNDSLHVVWDGKATDYALEQIWYAHYNGTAWVTPVRISTYEGMIANAQVVPSIAVDSNDSLHVVWEGKATGFPDLQIWYAHYNGTAWVTPVRISTHAGMDEHPQTKATIAVGSNDYLHVAHTGGAISDAGQIWYTKKTGAWLEPVQISTTENMIPAGYPSIAVGPDESIQVVYIGKVTAVYPNWQVFFSKKNGGWADPLRISTYDGMIDYDQDRPTIAIDVDYSTHVLWDGKATGYTIRDIVWYAEYTDSWATPEPLQTVGQNVGPNIRWSRFPAPRENSTYVVTDANGTDVLQDGLDSVDDAEDWIDTYDPDPEDPDPAGAWSEGPGGATGPFTRFKMRLYFLILGFGCIFGPVLFFSWRRPTGYYLMVGAFIMIVGLGLLLSIGDI